jgi:hypothetical protein
VTRKRFLSAPNFGTETPPRKRRAPRTLLTRPTGSGIFIKNPRRQIRVFLKAMSVEWGLIQNEAAAVIVSPPKR